MNINTIPLNIIKAILNRPHPPSHGVLHNPDIIPQSPPQHLSIPCIIPPTRWYIGKIKRLHLTDPVRLFRGAEIEVPAASTTDDELTGYGVGVEESAGCVVAVVHACDYGRAVREEGGGCGVVGVRVHGGGVGDVEEGVVG